LIRSENSTVLGKKRGVGHIVPNYAPMSYSHNALMGSGGALLSKLNRYDCFEVGGAPVFFWAYSEIPGVLGGYLNE